ncbi:hypothetical protein [Salipiger sp.]|uniref:hypothetical protein n=1 Tax=Salipiger sp. TaxID=2078585 RepID=UPI003A96B381
MSDAIPDAVTVTAAPVVFFRQGVRGAFQQAPALMTASFVMACSPEFDGRSLQARADASAGYSDVARRHVAAWLVNPRIKNEMMQEIFPRSRREQGCAPQDIRFATKTDDQIEVAEFVILNNLMPAIATLPQ